uniref:Leucine-rich repeat-containing N-terminal plant-type domain-containing protein n=1 Tax=Lactuca sativa TaxID=4236 RepID=A0A9R1UN76_LACSA|nr:hypothetical protein LSAT_V11C800404870 [Lactuca sativa]
MNLTGVLPKEFANLHSLQEIDLSRNYISGPIPASYGQLRLRVLSFLGNRINGSIPEALGDMSTLEEFRIDGTTLSGRIPDFIGNWRNLTRL